MLRTSLLYACMAGLTAFAADAQAQEAQTAAPQTSTRPPLRAAASGVEVQFDPATPGLALVQRTGTTPIVYVKQFSYYRERPTPVYSTLCEGACTQRMTPGLYTLALTRPGSPIVFADRPVLINQPAVIRGEYIDRSDIRTAGAVVAIAGPLAGLAMVFAGTYEGGGRFCSEAGACFNGEGDKQGLVLGGVGTLVGTVIIGSVMMMQDDKARFRIAPLAMASSGNRETASLPQSAQSAQGAALQWEF